MYVFEGEQPLTYLVLGPDGQTEVHAVKGMAIETDAPLDFRWVEQPVDSPLAPEEI
jgi:hypothetical protein